jgi:hypothetical protein
MTHSEMDEAGSSIPGRALKMVPIASLEASIALALRDLVGTEYVVDVRQLDFEPTPGAPWSDEVTFSVRAARRRPDLPAR